MDKNIFWRRFFGHVINLVWSSMVGFLSIVIVRLLAGHIFTLEDSFLNLFAYIFGGLTFVYVFALNYEDSKHWGDRF